MADSTFRTENAIAHFSLLSRFANFRPRKLPPGLGPGSVQDGQLRRGRGRLRIDGLMRQGSRPVVRRAAGKFRRPVWLIHDRQRNTLETLGLA